jgi:hypothetical protein
MESNMIEGLVVGMQTQEMSSIVEALKNCHSTRERIEILNQHPLVKNWIKRPSWLRTFSAHLSEECELVIKSLIVIGQEQALLQAEEGPLAEQFRALLEDLFPVETFYKEIGGIIGYHLAMMSFLSYEHDKCVQDQRQYHRPPGVDISIENEGVKRYQFRGIASLALMGEIYPVGGAADRLNFCDPQTGQPLPAALLKFCGHSLLEGLVRDVQAREYLYFKLFKEQITTPIAMMTSSEKDNHRQILNMCEEKQWFGRSKDAFRFFCQPLVPTIDQSGQWCFKGQLKLLLKPGGHGVIWKAAKDEGVFDWLEQLGRKKILVRQINNPIAGVDYGIIAFCGVGIDEDKSFGFASCPRQVQSAEGVNILIERNIEDETRYCLTNIEYCDFQKFGIADIPVTEGSTYSQFPSNTNILFADIAAVKEAVKKCPIPGMLVNLKKTQFINEEGACQEKEVARLESTMQNLADCFEQVSEFLDELSLKTYLTYNHRLKTISTAKKLFQPGAALLETPEGCFYDQLHNAQDVLSDYCHIVLPSIPDIESYIQHGPSFLFSYHPAIGPFYSIMAQKIQGGIFKERSELKLEIAEVELVDLTLSGCLHIIADRIVGEKDSQGILRYSEQVGCCRLKHVIVENLGYESQPASHFWQDTISRQGLCEILIHGNGQFYAENVCLSGNLKIEVEDGMKVTAYSERGELKFKQEPLSGHHCSWNYSLEEDHSIALNMN